MITLEAYVGCDVARKCKNALVNARCCSLFENLFQDNSAVLLGNLAKMTICHYQIKRSKRVPIIELDTRYQIMRTPKLLKYMNLDSCI